ncbi:MAG TPA: sugar phosphate nucleotidyltransferase [Bacteroidales bacterium]|nr:sugar phosphate nucleotidyltransferase [Bacteroidales bacterium]
MQAMILAAGLGTRLQPITDTIPKALVPVHAEGGGKKPLLEIQLEKMRQYGFSRIVINVHHFAGQVKAFISDYLESNHFPVRICISDESDHLLDTGGAIRKARSLFKPGEPVLVHNVDIISDLDLAQFFRRHDPAVHLATLPVSKRETSRQLLFDRHWDLAGWINRADGLTKWMEGRSPGEDYSMRAFTGIHMVSPRILEWMDQWPDVFSIIDFYLWAGSKGVVRGVDMPELHITDIGKPDTLRNTVI